VVYKPGEYVGGAQAVRVNQVGDVVWGSDVKLERRAPNVLAMGVDDTFSTGTGLTSARPSPTAVGAGAQWFDVTLGVPIWSNGTAWVNAQGRPV
jgi:hypothetical protein